MTNYTSKIPHFLKPTIKPRARRSTYRIHTRTRYTDGHQMPLKRRILPKFAFLGAGWYYLYIGLKIG